MKRRDPARPGSIPDVLAMFVCEVRFYREIAPLVGVRVPACYRAEEDGGATLLELEDLAAWSPGAAPVAAAQTLATLHRRFGGAVTERWPWLRRPGAAVDLVGELYDDRWPDVAGRADATPRARALGDRLVGRVADAERSAAGAGPLTLVHGDPSLRNMRTAPDGSDEAGTVALLDWEDVGAGPGVGDLAWLLVSSLDPARWDETVAAYAAGGGLVEGLPAALPAAAVQGILSWSFTEPGSTESAGWAARVDEAARRLG